MFLEGERDDDSEWKFKYQSRELLKSENEEIVMDDNQEEFYCSIEQEGMDDWVVARAAIRTEQVRTKKVKAGAKATTKVAVRTEQAKAQQVSARAQQLRARAREKTAVRVQQIRTQQAEGEVEVQQTRWSSIQ